MNSGKDYHFNSLVFQSFASKMPISSENEIRLRLKYYFCIEEWYHHRYEEGRERYKSFTVIAANYR